METWNNNTTKSEKEKFDKWRAKQIEMLKDFNYLTRAAAVLREVSSAVQIEKLQKLKL